MRYFGISLVVLAVSLGSLADSPSLTVQTVQGDVVPGSYIVKLKDGSNKATLIDTLQQKLASKFHLTHDYDPQFFNAFSGQLSPEAIQELSSDKNVEYITEDAIVHALGTQTNAPWGLQRISHRGPLPIGSNPNTLTYRYDYPDKAGSGVNVYIVDTGINTQHVNFGGRATFGYTTVDSKEDGNGHGTHCAGTAVGSLYGIARNAKVIAVKVLSDQGSGSTSGIIAGIDWVVKQYRQNRIPSVMSLSLGGARNIPLDHAVTCAVNAGVHTTVAAGNSNDDASKYSPAGAPKVITVGATTIADVRASFSNYGTVVDIYAPGQNVISSWIGSNTAVNNISGTSMATPHVAGIIAVLISQYGNMNPDRMRGLLLQLADKTSAGLTLAQSVGSDSTSRQDGGLLDKLGLGDL